MSREKPPALIESLAQARSAALQCNNNWLFILIIIDAWKVTCATIIQSISILLYKKVYLNKYREIEFASSTVFHQHYVS